MITWQTLDTLDYVYLTSIEEPRSKTVEITIEQASASDFDEDIESLGISVQSHETTLEPPGCYRIVFTDYVAYCVRNESLARNDTEEAFSGAIARVFTRSRFLDYLSATMFVSDAPGTHYGLLCLDHVVDVVTPTAPTITEIR